MTKKKPRRPFSPLIRSAALISLVFLIGTLGYDVLGGEEYDTFDALYMTAITLTTVGYGEVVDLSDNPAGRVFTIALLATGVGTFVYFFSNLTAFLVEGSLDEMFRERTMRKLIDSQTDHYIVCGGGHTGQHILEELLVTERPLVVIERDEQRLEFLQEHYEQTIPHVVGDATSDDVLRCAGIERARGIVATISNDKDNLIIALSARMLNPELRIVCRSVEPGMLPKFRRAGADAIVSPNAIGGLRMISELVRPNVVSFLDRMLRDGDRRLRVEELTLTDGSPLIGHTLAQLPRSDQDTLLVIAIEHPDQSWTQAPDGAVELRAGDRLIYIGGPATRARLEREATPA